MGRREGEGRRGGEGRRMGEGLRGGEGLREGRESPWPALSPLEVPLSSVGSVLSCVENRNH